ncbi:TPA: Hok/Gef family protein, partial [Klebsiella pneumoniae]|nr:Hok/Gef family protein [Klebsiella pneumoniae]
EYPEDDPIYGTYVTEGTFLVGKAKTIHDALECAKEAFTRGEWIVLEEEGRDEFVDHLTGRDQGPVSFSERTIEIRDKGDRLVLTGNARTLEWHRHVTSPDEIEKIKAQQKDLYQKASYESGWDNYETARQLRRQAEQLSLGFVEECWRNHPEVIQAVEKFEYPVFIDEEMALFNADQDAGID